MAAGRRLNEKSSYQNDGDDANTIRACQQQADRVRAPGGERVPVVRYEWGCRRGSERPAPASALLAAVWVKIILRKKSGYVMRSTNLILANNGLIF
jgi:hypothetical protein